MVRPLELFRLSRLSAMVRPLELFRLSRRVSDAFVGLIALALWLPFWIARFLLAPLLRRDRCPCCGSRDIRAVLALKSHPYWATAIGLPCYWGRCPCGAHMIRYVGTNCPEAVSRAEWESLFFESPLVTEAATRASASGS